MRVLVDTSVWSLALRRETPSRHPETEELRNLVASHVVEIDKKSLFMRHGHPPAGTGLNERFHGGNVAATGWWRQVFRQDEQDFAGLRRGDQPNSHHG